MRKALKLLHTLGAIALIGALSGCLILYPLIPSVVNDVDRYADLLGVLDRLARYLLLPGLGIAVVSGLLSMAFVKGFHNAGWAWAKLASGVLMFEGTLLAVQGPIQKAAREAVDLIASHSTAVPLQTVLDLTAATAVVFAVALFNVVIGIWRPRFTSSTNASS